MGEFRPDMNRAKYFKESIQLATAKRRGYALPSAKNLPGPKKTLKASDGDDLFNVRKLDLPEIEAEATPEVLTGDDPSANPSEEPNGDDLKFDPKDDTGSDGDEDDS